jgi:hypothetical protein
MNATQQLETKAEATPTVTTNQAPKYQPILQGDLKEILTGIFDAKALETKAKAALTEATKGYERTLLGLPVIYSASVGKGKKTVEQICAIAGLDYAKQGQTVLYYITGGSVMARLRNDGKTSPASIMKAVNYAAQNTRDITHSEIKAIVEVLASDEGKTWADFVALVEKSAPSKATANAVNHVINNMKDVSDADADRLRLALATRK